MPQLTRTLCVATLAMLASLPAFADGRKPGSVLVYPVHDSGPDTFSLISVTNTNPLPAGPSSAGGTTAVQFEYVNTSKASAPGTPLTCTVFDRVETLTPADTLTVLTTCHNIPGGQRGYVVVTAQDPLRFKQPWSWNHLVGSELLVTALGGVCALNSIPFSSPLEERTWTDLDLNGRRDFDGLEYEGVPDELYMEFVAGMESTLVLINLTGGTSFNSVVKFDLWNDNEFALSATHTFRCWGYERLIETSAIFSEDFLRHNTPNDPTEIDQDCDQVGDHEAGWAIISGLSAYSQAQTFHDPALLGALCFGGTREAIAEGRLLWESSTKQHNAAFLNFGEFWEDPREP